MKHASAWLMALAFTIPQTLSAEGTDMTQDQHNALAAVETMTAAFQASDIATVMASYEPGASVLFEPATPVADPEILRQMFTAMASLNPTFDYGAGHDVVVSGDIALHIAPWAMNGKTPEGDTVSQSGLSVAVLRKGADGAWKMVIDNPHGGRLLAPQN